MTQRAPHDPELHPKASPRSQRRHDDHRLKKARKGYWAIDQRPSLTAQEHARLLGQALSAPKNCSCWMCRNERAHAGPTFAERHAARRQDEGLAEWSSQ